MSILYEMITRHLQNMYLFLSCHHFRALTFNVQAALNMTGRMIKNTVDRALTICSHLYRLYVPIKTTLLGIVENIVAGSFENIRRYMDLKNLI